MSAGPETVAQAVRAAAEVLEAIGGTGRLDAELLMAGALGVSRSDLLLRHMAEPVPAEFAGFVRRRQGHEPVAHILGHQEFYGLDFHVSRDVLIPRADSEVLVEQALALRPDAGRVLDCGTGSGALLLAVLAHLPDAVGTGIDRSEAALAVARRNAEALGLAGRASMVMADWDEAGWDEAGWDEAGWDEAGWDEADWIQARLTGGRFDLILANPPYVELDADLSPSVRDHEPAGALFAGADGLDAYRVLVPQLPGLLSPDGLALVEIGASQAEQVREIATNAGLATELYRDLAGRPRVLAMSTRITRPD